MKEELPRIRFANPALVIEVDKLDPTNPKQKAQKSSITLEYGALFWPLSTTYINLACSANRPAQTISITQARSTGLLTDLMALAGSPAWSEWVKQRTAKGEPIIPEPEAPAEPQAASTGPTAVLSKKSPWRVRAPKAAAAKDAAMNGKGVSGGKQEKGKGDIKELLGVADVGMPSLNA